MSAEIIYKVGQAYNGSNGTFHDNLLFTPSMIPMSNIENYFDITSTLPTDEQSIMDDGQMIKQSTVIKKATLKQPIVSYTTNKIFEHKIGTADVYITEEYQTKTNSAGIITESKTSGSIVLPAVSQDKYVSAKNGGKRRNKRTTKKARRTRRRSSK